MLHDAGATNAFATAAASRTTTRRRRWRDRGNPPPLAPLAV
jgi:hypothetical protein